MDRCNLCRGVPWEASRCTRRQEPDNRRELDEPMARDPVRPRRHYANPRRRHHRELHRAGARSTPSTSITLDVYADLFEDDLDAAAIALDDAAMKSDVAKVLPRSRFAAPTAE